MAFKEVKIYPYKSATVCIGWKSSERALITGTEEVFETWTISECAPHRITQAATIELMTVDVSCKDSFT